MSQKGYKLDLEQRERKEELYHESVEYRNSLFLQQEEEFRICAKNCIAEDMRKSLKKCKFECKYIFDDYAKQVLDKYPDEAQRILKAFPDMPLYQYSYFQSRMKVPMTWRQKMQGIYPDP